MILNTREQAIKAWEDHKERGRLCTDAQAEKPSVSFSKCAQLIDEIYDGNKCKYPVLFAGLIKTCIARGDFKYGEVSRVLDMASRCEKVKLILEGSGGRIGG